MKILNITFLLLLSTLLIQAQTKVNLKINHMLGSKAFKFNTLVTTPAGYSVQVKRMDYFISKIKLVHDGGKETKLDSIYILEDASTGMVHNLGNRNITNLEGIKFSIGVDNDPHVNPNDSSNNTTNHTNPALWPSGHALAPKMTNSMHWGWTAGYRFAAMEGGAGAGGAFTFEIHALGDANYFEVNLPVKLSAKNGELNIVLNADYLQSLNNIDVSKGLIEHSETGNATTYLKNFQSSVFSVAETTDPVSVQKVVFNPNFSVGPNPNNGILNVDFISPDESNYKLNLFNINGALVSSQPLTQNKEAYDLNVDLPGVYLVSITENNVVVFTKKMTIVP